MAHRSALVAQRLPIVIQWLTVPLRSNSSRAASRAVPSYRYLLIYLPICAVTWKLSEKIENKADWPVYILLSGPICARALKLQIPRRLSASGHHDWPDNWGYRPRADDRSGPPFRLAEWPTLIHATASERSNPLHDALSFRREAPDS